MKTYKKHCCGYLGVSSYREFNWKTIFCAVPRALWWHCGGIWWCKLPFSWLPVSSECAVVKVLWPFPVQPLFLLGSEVTAHVCHVPNWVWCHVFLLLLPALLVIKFFQPVTFASGLILHQDSTCRPSPQLPLGNGLCHLTGPAVTAAISAASLNPQSKACTHTQHSSGKGEQCRGSRLLPTYFHQVTSDTVSQAVWQQTGRCWMLSGTAGCLPQTGCFSPPSSSPPRLPHLSLTWCPRFCWFLQLFGIRGMVASVFCAWVSNSFELLSPYWNTSSSVGPAWIGAVCSWVFGSCLSGQDGARSYADDAYVEMTWQHCCFMY